MTVAPSVSSSYAVGVMIALDSSLSSGISNWKSSAESLSRRARSIFWASMAIMRSSSIGLSAFFPFRTRDRHLEFASLRCLRGDRPRSATRIDRLILLKNDLLAFGRALIDAASCSATWVLLPSTERRFTSCAGLPLSCCFFCGASFAISQFRMPRRDLVARERLVVAYYAIAATVHTACVIAQSTLAWTRTRHRPSLSQILQHSPPKKRTPCTSLDTVGTLSSTACRNAAAKTKTRAASAPRKDKNIHLKHKPPSAAAGPNSRRPPTPRR